MKILLIIIVVLLSIYLYYYFVNKSKKSAYLKAGKKWDEIVKELRNRK